jgi:hypothetical protein
VTVANRKGLDLAAIIAALEAVAVQLRGELAEAEGRHSDAA